MKTLTNWTEATRNPFKAISSLISCLQAGRNAWLELQENGNQEYPLREKLIKESTDPCAWDCACQPFAQDWEERKEVILTSDSYSPMQKKFMTEYTSVFGSQEQYDNYLKTGDADFRGIGRQYLIKYDDLARKRKEQGIALSPKTRFYPMVSLKSRNKRPLIKGKVLVVCYNNDKVKTPWWVSLINIVLYPFRFIPKRTVLRMPEYNVYTFRIGSVVNGFCIDIHLPKKFSFS